MNLRVIIGSIALVCCVVLLSVAGDDGVLFHEDFEKAETGSVPNELMVLNGSFAVKADDHGRFLELPGSPVEGFGLLFGPTETDGVSVSARIWGTPRGRLNPAFGVGLNGVTGPRLQVAPGKRAVEILLGDAPKAQAEFEWKADAWTWLRLQVRQMSGAKWIVEGKAWTHSASEPKDWMISLEQQEAPPPGRASIWGSPYSGKPIRFDDLTVTTIANGN